MSVMQHTKVAMSDASCASTPAVSRLQTSADHRLLISPTDTSAHTSTQDMFNGTIMSRGPPYASPFAAPGGLPTISIDVPISAVFLLLYLLGAIVNLTTFRIDLKHDRRFLISWALGGFCASRVLTCILRIAWATKPESVRIAIAATVFTNAGVIVVYIVNFILTLRILRARQPTIGWSRVLHCTSIALYVAAGIGIALLVSMIVTSAYTLDQQLLHHARNIELAVITYFTILAFLAPSMLALSLLMPTTHDVQQSGQRDIHFKILLLGLTTSLSSVIACYRVGTSWQTPRPITSPAWYDTRAAFYCFGFTMEVLIVLLFIVTRIDRVFFVPKGSSKRRSYQEVDEKGSRSDSESGRNEEARMQQEV
ncbi:hypothetical protein LTR53_010924 [Teratosphaeriaceae sp. CCFEE 6253]|nr:hypothetical protein LTR53_010924 [Teratosphaeriaceae sp. CCFEE 6253]